VTSFYLQLGDWWSGGSPQCYFYFFLWIWLVVWLPRAVLSCWYRGFAMACRPSHSVVLPVVEEASDAFRKVVARIVEQSPDEVYVVINGPRNKALEEVCAEFAPAVRWEWTAIADKRHAEALGLAATTGEIVIFVDSDTHWTSSHEGTLAELLKPFLDPKVGGVTSHQEVRNAGATAIARFAAWLEAVRWIFGPPAQSVLGQVGILPGRTIAFRREILIANLEEFLVAPMKISDDREQTMFAIRAGYRTVYQSTAVVTTTAPTTFRTLFRQQYRWAKGSQFNTFRWFPIMLRKAPFACYCFTVDMITPFFLVGVLFAGLWRGIGAFVTDHTLVPAGWGKLLVLSLTFLGWYFAVALRTIPRLVAEPREWLRLPVYALLGLALMLPARILGLVTAGWVLGSGWGTRREAVTDQPEIAHLGFTLRYGPTILGLLLLVFSIALGSMLGGAIRW
jgi:hyaluronan synthase